jgi:hypothetical protein
VCAAETQVNFARLVGDLDSVLHRFASCPVNLTWDCEDIALFDMPGTRILLGWNEGIGLDSLSCLTISVGPSPIAAVAGQFPAHDTMCVQLAERVQRRIPHEAVLWHHIPGVATSETLDELVDALPRLTTPDIGEMLNDEAALQAEATHKLAEAEEVKAMKRQPEGEVPRWHDPELGRLREALYPYGDDAPKAKQPSRPMQLAAHAMNATLLAVNAPVAALVMTYGFLKGGDMRFSARAMTLASLVVALSNTELASNLAALA